MNPSFSSRRAHLLPSVRTWAALLLLGLTGLLAACGGGGGGGAGAPSPPAVTLTSIAITPPTASIQVGATSAFTATGTYSDGTSKAITTSVTWASSAGGIASIVSSTGVATGVAPGTTNISASLSGVNSGTAVLTVTAVPVTLTSMAVTPGSPSVAVGTTSAFRAVATYSDASTAVVTTTATWQSDTPNVATIDPTGVASSLATGTAGIKASLSGITSPVVTLTVTAAPTLTSISLYTATPSVPLGLTSTFFATGTYSNGATKNISSSVTWNSSDANVANISAAGVITPAGPGPTDITATLGGVNSAPTPITVTAATLTSIAVTPANPRIANGKTVQFKAAGNYSDSVVRDVTSVVAWTSATTGVATIDAATGLATAAGLGTSGITATPPGVAAVTVTLTVAANAYAYATNFDDATVSQYLIGISDGALTPQTVPTVITGVHPFAISVEPTGQYAYVANYGANNLSEFTRGSDGTLTPVGAGVIATGTHPNGVTIDHSDRYAYVTNFGGTGTSGGNSISEFNIGTDGALTAMTPATVPTGANPASAVVDPQNHFVYVANFGSPTVTAPTSGGTLSQYVLNVDGSLTPMATPTVDSGGGGPNAVVVDATSHFAYAVNAGSNTLAQFTINSDGGLVPLGSPIATGIRPFSVAIDPSNHYVYVANSINSNASAAGTISQYKILPDGSLAQLGGGAVAAGLGVSSVTIDPLGKFLYATNRGTSTVSQYSIDQMTGQLSPMATPTVASGLHPAAIATAY